MIKNKYYLVDANFYQAFYLMSKFKNIIISDSKLSIFASYFNYQKKKILGHNIDIAFAFLNLFLRLTISKCVLLPAPIIKSKPIFSTPSIPLLNRPNVINSRI